MTDLSVNAAATQKKNYVAKGAAIAAGIQLARLGSNMAIASKQAGKDVFVATVKKFGVGKYAAACAASVALMAGIGAGIGKIVEHCKAKKAEKAQ